EEMDPVWCHELDWVAKTLRPWNPVRMLRTGRSVRLEQTDSVAQEHLQVDREWARRRRNRPHLRSYPLAIRRCRQRTPMNCQRLVYYLDRDCDRSCGPCRRRSDLEFLHPLYKACSPSQRSLLRQVDLRD